MRRSTSYPALRAFAVSLTATLFTFLLVAVASAQGSTQDIVDQIDRTVYQHYLDDLLYTHPGDDRGYGAEHDLARQNIFDTFVSFGLDVRLDPFTYRSNTYYNVVAMKLGTVRPQEQLIIGAHYDSVGNPGADDNGSGTSGVMEIARVLSQYEFERTILFIAFDREEQGLKGSNAYATEFAGDHIRGMVSMDMIGYNTGAQSVDLYGRSASNGIKNALAAAVSQYSGGLGSVQHGAYDASDHAPFEWQGFQACLIIEDWGNPYYHSSNDNVEMPNYIDYDFATQITKSVCGWLVDEAVVISSGRRAELLSCTIATGDLLGGDLPELAASDDAYVRARSGYGATLVDVHNMEMIVAAVTTVGTPATLDLTIESRINEPAGTAQVRMRNWMTNEFDPVGAYAIGNADQVDVINSIDATNHVNDPGGTGDIELSIKHIVFVPFLAFTFESWIDQVEIVVQ